MGGELGDLELDQCTGDAGVCGVALEEEADGACGEAAVLGAHDVLAVVVECLVVYGCVWQVAVTTNPKTCVEVCDEV